MTVSGGKADGGLCPRKDCSYYSKSTRTCDYRLKTGEGRGVPVSRSHGCDKYTTEEIKPKISIGGEVAWMKPQQPKGAKEQMGMKPQFDWEAIMTEHDNGATAKELGAKHGFHAGTLYGYLKQRQALHGTPIRSDRRKARIGKSDGAPPAPGKIPAPPPKREKRAESAPDGVPERPPAQEENVALCQEEHAVIRGMADREDVSLSVTVPWYAEDLQRIAAIVSMLKPTDPPSLYLKAEDMAKQMLTEMFGNRAGRGKGQGR